MSPIVALIGLRSIGHAESDDQHVDLRRERDAVARLGRRRFERELAVGGPRDGHEEVERRRGAGQRSSVLGDGGGEVLGAAGMVGRAAEQPVALGVARGDERVVDARTGVLHQGDQRPAAGAVDGVTDAGHEAAQRGAGVLHRRVLVVAVAWVGERPPVHHLAAVAVDDLEPFAGRQRDGGAVAGGQNRRLGHRGAMFPSGPSRSSTERTALTTSPASASVMTSGGDSTSV